MTDGTGTMSDRMKQLIKSRRIALCVIGGALSVGFFVAEIKKLLAGNPTLLDYLYLGLLVSLAIKIAAWILVSDREIDIVSRWLDPEDYEPPAETVLVLMLGITL